MLAHVPRSVIKSRLSSCFILLSLFILNNSLYQTSLPSLITFTFFTMSNLPHEPEFEQAYNGMVLLCLVYEDRSLMVMA